MSAWSIVRLSKTKVERGLTVRALSILFVCLAGMLLATRFAAFGLIIAASAAIALFSMQDRSRLVVKQSRVGIYPALLLGAVVAAGLYAMLPVYYDQARQVKAGATGSYTIGKAFYKGVYADPAEINIITQVDSEITRLQPTTIFSYPIQAYFYVNVPRHAAKFLTYEPQTTLSEQNDTIEDLKKNKPEVVIFDPVQALDLSGSLYKISDYVLTHYKIEKVITGKRIEWVMTPSDDVASGARKAIFSLYKENNKQEIIGMQNPEKSVNNAIGQSLSTVAKFSVGANDKKVVFSLYNEGAQDVCGNVAFMRHADVLSRTKLCGTAVPYNLEIPFGATGIQLTVDQSLVWNDLTIEGFIDD